MSGCTEFENKKKHFRFSPPQRWLGKGGESREWECVCVCLCEFIYWKRLFCVDSIRAVTGSCIRNPNPHQWWWHFVV